MSTLEWVLWPALGAVLTGAVVFEHRGRPVPLVVPWAAAVAFVAARGAAEGLGGPFAGLVSGVLGGAICAGPFLVLAIAGGRTGWGDVALMASVGAALGLARALYAVMFIAVCGAVVAMVKAATSRRTNATVDRPRSIPYGLPIAVGTLWAMLWVVPNHDAPDEVGVEWVEPSDGGYGDGESR